MSNENTQNTRNLSPEEVNVLIDNLLLSKYKAKEEMEAIEKNVNQWLRVLRETYIKMTQALAEKDREIAMLKEELKRANSHESMHA